MNPHNILLAIQLISILGLFVEGRIVFGRLKNSLHAYLFLSSVCALTNNLGYLLELWADTKGAYIAALKFSYLGRGMYAFFMFLFVAELVGKRPPATLKMLLLTIHAAVYAVIFTIPLNNLYYSWTEFDKRGIFPALHHGNGIVHHFTMGLQVIYIITSLIMLCVALIKAHGKAARRRMFIVLAAIIVQTVFFAIQLTGFIALTEYYDVTMIGYFLGTILMLVAIFSCDLLGTQDIAREFVIDRISEGIIAVDGKGMIRYFNEPASRLFPELKRLHVMERDRVSKRDRMQVPQEITQAVESGGSITIGERIYIPEENELVNDGEVVGRLYALVDETEHYKYMKELQEQREIADSANASKSRFLANMSHEIRTPINAVLGMDEMILRESEDKTIRAYAADIMSAGKTLLSLINDILDFSKVEEGKMEIIPVQYELSSLINDLVNMIRDRAEKKGLHLEIGVDPHIPHLLFGDEIRIRQCVLNLLTNAVKYTEQGTVTMTVSFEDQGENILLGFTVRDTGIGMKQEDMEKLFSPYQRIEEKRNRSIEGTGLGMSITRQLLSLMGTELHVESEYGKGSVFSFTVEQKVVSRDEIGDYAGKLAHLSGSRQEYRELFHAPDARILVVDDTEMNLTVIQSLLKKTQLCIDTASSGREALTLAGENAYDVVFVDHMMPDMDGIETLKRLREIPGREETPAVALTANAISGARETYLAAGFTDYLSKPVDGEKLEHLLLHLLPEDKTITAEAPDFSKGVDSAGISGEAQAQAADEEGLPDWLMKITEIDTQAGLKNCGSDEGYRSVLTVFHQTAPDKADEIQRLYDQENIAEYTIRVHALKSSARIIGAAELSHLAEKLEQAGKDQDLILIREQTDTLLSMYRDLNGKLAALDGNKDELPQIEAGAMREAYQTIREIAQSMDYGLMEGLLADLRGYRFSAADEENIAKIEKLLTELDWDGIMIQADKGLGEQHGQ